MSAASRVIGFGILQQECAECYTLQGLTLPCPLILYRQFRSAMTSLQVIESGLACKSALCSQHAKLVRAGIRPPFLPDH